MLKVVAVFMRSLVESNDLFQIFMHLLSCWCIRSDVNPLQTHITSYIDTAWSPYKNMFSSCQKCPLFTVLSECALWISSGHKTKSLSVRNCPNSGCTLWKIWEFPSDSVQNPSAALWLPADTPTNYLSLLRRGKARLPQSCSVAFFDQSVIAWWKWNLPYQR